jgi:hypothetical protein
MLAHGFFVCDIEGKGGGGVGKWGGGGRVSGARVTNNPARSSALNSTDTFPHPFSVHADSFLNE